MFDFKIGFLAKFCVIEGISEMMYIYIYIYIHSYRRFIISAGYHPWGYNQRTYEPTDTKNILYVCMYIISLIPSITQNFARNPILKSNIGATSGLFWDIWYICPWCCSPQWEQCREAKSTKTRDQLGLGYGKVWKNADRSATGARLDGGTTVGDFSYRAMAEP